MRRISGWERLKPVQWAGLVGIAIGMIAIALP